MSGLLLAIGAGCGTAKTPPAVTPAQPALQALLAGTPIAPVRPIVWTDVAAFYAQRNGAPAWIDESHDNSTERATSAVALLRTAHAHGLDGDYDVARIAELPALIKTLDKTSPDRVPKLAELDVRITTALLALGRDVALGRSKPEAIDPRWKSQRTTPDFPATLNQAVRGSLPAWLDSIRPPHPEYVALQKALADLEDHQKKVGSIIVSDDATLRQRLTRSGDLKGGDLTAAVRSFQNLHAIKETGVLDAATRLALNVPIEERISQLRVNLERWRWAPDTFGANYFIVNIPQFLLTAVEDHKPVMDIRVVVGKPEHTTPVFSSEMETVVFSPYWNIPDSIAKGETTPAIGRDRNYLAKNNIEVVRVSNNSTEVIDASRVNWDDPKALRGLAFRQRPGANNSLGQVAFLFPNAFEVYLHDTPADALFSKQSRAFSHGCVRVEEPEKLAYYVLRDDKEWNVARMNAAMHAGVERHVRLPAKIPVHLVYFTAWVDEAGGLHFQPDIYGYDKKQGGGLQ